ncbi:Mch2 protein [Martiniozyma asiatica (nom. inval.)]|nr:Mch2 protein [Martiniozyma asiatica]
MTSASPVLTSNSTTSIHSKSDQNQNQNLNPTPVAEHKLTNESESVQSIGTDLISIVYNYDANVDDNNNDHLSEIKSIKSVKDEIPDKFSGWGLCSVISVVVFNFNTWGANSAYSLYLQEYLSKDIFPGADKYDYGILGGLTFGSGLVFAPLINFFIGKVGIKPIVTLGILLNFAGIFLASFATKLWQIYCTQGVMSGIGMALICIPNITVIPQWFKGGPGGKRNLAMGISAGGSGLGGIVYNIGLEPLLKNRSYKWSLRAQAIMSLGLNCIALLLIKSRNASIKPVFKVYDRAVWTCFGTLCLVLWIMFTLFGYVVLMYNLGDFTRSLGYSTEEASVVSTMVAVGIIYGRPSVGKVGDIIGPINVTIAASLLVALFSWAMWIPCRNYATAIVFAMFVGSLMGTIWLTMATITASIIGLRKFGIAMSVCWIATGVFGFVSPIIGLSLKKNGPASPTQYQPASIFVGLCYFMAGLCLYILRSWIIQRNQIVKEMKDDDVLTDHLDVKVGFKNVFKGMLAPKMEKV